MCCSARTAFVCWARQCFQAGKLSDCFYGAPDRIRTCGLCLRRATLYPAELRVRLRVHLADCPAGGNVLLGRWRGAGARPFQKRVFPAISAREAFPRRESPSVRERIACGSFPSSPYVFLRSVRLDACRAYFLTEQNNPAPGSLADLHPIRHAVSASALKSW